MDWAGRCAVVIPCHDEAGAIGGVVAGALRVVPGVLVIVVDDGSRDGTGEAASGAGARVERMTANGGKGAALCRGLEVAGAAGREWAVVMDGDGQHAPEDLPALLAAAEVPGVDLVVGNRMTSAAAMPWVRRQVNRWMSRDLSRLLGVEIPDSQCGFRVVRLDAWFRVMPEGAGFLIESEMLARFVSECRCIAHVPVRVRPRAHGRSRIRVIRDTIRWWRWRWGLRRGVLRRLGGASGG